MKSRTFYSAIAFLAGLFVLVGVVGFWGLTAQNPKVLLTEGGQPQPSAAQFVPRQSPVMVSLLARPDRLWQLRQLLTPASNRAAARQEWQSLQRSFETLVGWDYEADVRPWLDEEATFAVTAADLDHDADNGLQPGYLLVLSCRDAAAAREALHLLWQQRAAQGRSLVFETVAGVPLISDRALPAMTPARSAPADLTLTTLATALVGDRYVLLANDVQVLRQAMTTYSAPDVSLATTADYREAIATLPANRVGWVYANVPSLLAWLGIADADSQRPFRPTGQKLSRAFISLQALADGLLGHVAIAPPPAAPSLKPETPPQTADSSPAPMLALLPKDTLFASVGDSLSQRLQTLATNIGGYPFTQQAWQVLLTSLSLEPTLVGSDLAASWPGDYAVGLLPGAQPEWVLITRSPSDDLATIDDFATAQGLTVSRIPYQDQSITVWTRLALTRTQTAAPLNLTTQVVAVHAPVQDYEVLATSLAGLQRIWQQASAAPLTTAASLAPLVAQFDRADHIGDSLTYLDWPSVAPRLTQRLPWLRALEVAGQPFTAHIGPILISSDPATSALATGAIAIQLQENPRKTS